MKPHVKFSIQNSKYPLFPSLLQPRNIFFLLWLLVAIHCFRCSTSLFPLYRFSNAASEYYQSEYYPPDAHRKIWNSFKAKPCEEKDNASDNSHPVVVSFCHLFYYRIVHSSTEKCKNPRTKEKENTKPDSPFPKDEIG